MSISQEVYSCAGCVPGGDSGVFSEWQLGKWFWKGFFKWFFDRSAPCLAVWCIPIDTSLIENTRQSLVCLKPKSLIEISRQNSKQLELQLKRPADNQEIVRHSSFTYLFGQ